MQTLTRPLSGVVDLFYEPFMADDVMGFGSAVLSGVHSLTANAFGEWTHGNHSVDIVDWGQ